MINFVLIFMIVLASIVAIFAGLAVVYAIGGLVTAVVVGGSLGTTLFTIYS